MPNFHVAQTIDNVGAIEGLQLDKAEPSSFIKSVKQATSFELFTVPESAGTPLLSIDRQDQTTGLVDDSFVMVVN